MNSHVHPLNYIIPIGFSSAQLECWPCKYLKAVIIFYPQSSHLFSSVFSSSHPNGQDEGIFFFLWRLRNYSGNLHTRLQLSTTGVKMYRKTIEWDLSAAEGPWGLLGLLGQDPRLQLFTRARQQIKTLIVSSSPSTWLIMEVPERIWKHLPDLIKVAWGTAETYLGYSGHNHLDHYPSWGTFEKKNH